MIGRLLTRILNAQRGWAKPLGNFNVRWLGALLRPIRPIKDFLNGRWIGHSVHAAITDVPIGALTLALLFDVLNMRSAADIALGLGILAMVGSAVAGAADYVDTDDDARVAATVHSTLMTIALVVYVISLVLRLGAPEGDRTLAIGLSVVGYLVLVAGAWVGGEVVYAMGNMVNRHAWRFGSKSSWVKLDVAEIPEGTPVAARAGAQSLVVVRQGERIYALHNQCAHANGPLAEGRIVDGCIECPWHFSRFELATGRRRQGPTTFDQPLYDVRAAEGGGWEVRRVVPGHSPQPAAPSGTAAGG
jgi:nitrite reductase/ring-hydroxylating ferredoxin subunit